MARPPRDQSAGVRHLTCRGNRRQPIFDDNFDRERYLVLLAKVVRLCSWRVIAYCLMTNHVHLVVDVPEGTLSRGMQLLNGQYAQAYNRRHGWVGHLFQGRFHSVRVDSEAHLMALSCYVPLNPERAGVAKAVRWRWSSHRALLGLEPAPPFLDVRGTLDLFGRTQEQARMRYAELVHAAAARPRPALPPAEPANATGRADTARRQRARGAAASPENRGQTPGQGQGDQLPPGRVPDD